MCVPSQLYTAGLHVMLYIGAQHSSTEVTPNILLSGPVHSSKLRLHKRQADPGPHLDPCLLPQFSREEEAEVRYAYSWICGSNLAHIPPPQKPTLPLCQLWAPETKAQEVHPEVTWI